MTSAEIILIEFTFLIDCISQLFLENDDCKKFRSYATMNVIISSLGSVSNPDSGSETENVLFNVAAGNTHLPDQLLF